MGASGKWGGGSIPALCSLGVLPRGVAWGSGWPQQCSLQAHMVLVACVPCSLLTGNGLAPGSPALPVHSARVSWPCRAGHDAHDVGELTHPSSYAGGAGSECERLKGVTVGLPSFLLPLESIRLVGVASPGSGCLSPRLTVPPPPHPRGWAWLVHSFPTGLSLEVMSAERTWAADSVSVSCLLQGSSKL